MRKVDTNINAKIALLLFGHEAKVSDSLILFDLMKTNRGKREMI